MKVRIYYAYINKDFLNISKNNFSAYRLKKLENVNEPLHLRQSMAAELLLSIAAENEKLKLPLNIRCNEHGKPFIPCSSFKFNISHSENMVICAASEVEIGADVQQMKIYNPKLAARFFSADENEYIMTAADHDAAFTQIWTLKESYIKALGRGLSLPLDSFSVIENTDRLRICKNKNYGFYSEQLNNYFISVCILNSENPEPVWTEVEL